MSREYALHTFSSPVNLQIDYARELNEQQYAAVIAQPGPALVIAGAGSGKTRTLTYRVAYLLEQGIPPDRILLLTFTNKAAKEMMRRVADLLGGSGAEGTLWGGTFHSIGARILRRHAELLGYRADFTILDREDATDLIKACVGDSEIDIKATRFPKADVLLDIFSTATNTGKSAPQVLAEQYDYFVMLAPLIEELWERYTARKKKANVMDFDDLLALWLRLLQQHPDVCERYQRKFQFLLVDEYQDTNKLQSDLIDLVAQRHRQVMVVGDDSQSIYAWRGANFKNILQFPDRYPDAQIYKIEVNYRSTPEILNVANAAISPNIHQFTKVLSAARKPGPKPVLVACQDGGQQAAFVVQRVLELRDEGVELSKIAVLYRSHYHALELQIELTRRNIPFTITSGIRFFEQTHLKDVAAYLKFTINPQDELSFKRLVRMLPGVGNKGADKLWQRFVEELQQPRTGSRPLATTLQACAPVLSKRTGTAWTELAITISQIEVESVRQRPGQMIHLVLEAFYEEYLQENFPNYRNRLEDLEQLATFAQQFKSTEEFLTQLSLLGNLEAEEDRAATKDTEQLRLSTIHQAKGLEFEAVFVIMLCDGLFPASRSLESLEGEEEERRLFYVAITRARQELYLSYPILRMTQGYGVAVQQRSRFLAAIPADLLDEWTLKSSNPYG